MKKILYMIIALLAVCGSAYCQTGINTQSADPSAVLDIRSPASGNKGVLIPQMTTSAKLAITNPANSLLVYDTDKNCISQNLGTETDPQWTCLTNVAKSFFYMPSINISTTTLGAGSIDLYNVYKSQFVAPQYASPGAPVSIPQFPNATDLYYYVTYHNSSRITINSINANGVMNYTTLKKANYDDYINIVFVVK